MAAAYPGCGVSWNLLAGIGRIESMHANNGATDYTQLQELQLLAAPYVQAPDVARRVWADLAQLRSSLPAGYRFEMGGSIEESTSRAVPPAKPSSPSTYQGSIA